jgi:hypothetical protein
MLQNAHLSQGGAALILPGRGGVGIDVFVSGGVQASVIAKAPQVLAAFEVAPDEQPCA